MCWCSRGEMAPEPGKETRSWGKTSASQPPAAPRASAGCKEGGKGLRQVVVMRGVCCSPPKNRLER